MTRPRALIVGCGRMGAGRDHQSPLLYNHAAAYQAFPDRVELLGFVDRVLPRAEWAAEHWGAGFAGDDVAGALETLRPEIVSVCTPPSDRAEIIGAADAYGVPAIWCEKPLALSDPPKALCQVNYIRRWDSRHMEIRARRHNALRRGADAAHLFVIAARDVHTVPHFTDLARWWGIPKANLHYQAFHGPSLYVLREPGETPGRYQGWRDEAFVGGGVQTGFMERALGNLLDALEGTAALESPAEEAILSEAWAEEILNG